MSRTRWRTEVPIWSPWKHISRFSGELTLGRVCFDFYFDSPRLAPKVRVLKSRIIEEDRPSFPRSFALSCFGALLIVRRWKR